MFRRFALSLIALAIAAGLAACGGGKSKSGSTPTTQPAATPSPIPAAAQTAVALGGQDPLAGYTDVQGRFTLQAPAGWQLEQSFNTVTFTLPGDPIDASITVLCVPNLTTDALIQQDAALIANVGGGTLPVDSAKATTVGGIAAKEIQWTGKLGALPLPHDTYYFEGGGCAWRIQLTAFGGVDIGSLNALFRSVLDTFKLTPASG